MNYRSSYSPQVVTLFSKTVTQDIFLDYLFFRCMPGIFALPKKHIFSAVYGSCEVKTGCSIFT
jgi:hypothetical protein